MIFLMKKFTTLFLGVTFVLFLVSCNNSGKQKVSDEDSDTMKIEDVLDKADSTTINSLDTMAVVNDSLAASVDSSKIDE